MKLYSYFRSSAAYRVRIALNLKGIDWETISVNLLTGEQKGSDYLKLNPHGRVPAIDHEGDFISQSPAILEYMEEVFKDIPLLPQDALSRARVREAVNIIACDIHPLNNLAVLKYLKTNFSADEAAISDWYGHWIKGGFKAAEAMVGDGPYFFGDKPSLADVYLVPQMYNARRFKVDLTAFPKLVAVDAHCNKQQVFVDALPENQPDAT